MTSPHEIIRFCAEEDVKFVRLAFCDLFGGQKNISVMPSQLERAFERGIPFDGAAVRGFAELEGSELLLFPDPETISILPWRPEKQRVARMYCSIKRYDGTVAECDTRTLLNNTVMSAAEKGYSFGFGQRHEITLLTSDRYGLPYDEAGYMDIPPLDKCSDTRRQICLMLDRMGIYPKSSFHGTGEGQCSVALGSCGPLNAADNCMTFYTAARTSAAGEGLYVGSENVILSISVSGRGAELSDAANGIKDNIRGFAPVMEIKGSPKLSDTQNGTKQLSFSAMFGNPYTAFALLICAAVEGMTGEIPTENVLGRYLPKAMAEILERQ